MTTRSIAPDVPAFAIAPRASSTSRRNARAQSERSFTIKSLTACPARAWAVAISMHQRSLP